MPLRVEITLFPSLWTRLRSTRPNSTRKALTSSSETPSAISANRSIKLEFIVVIILQEQRRIMAHTEVEELAHEWLRLDKARFPLYPNSKVHSRNNAFSSRILRQGRRSNDYLRKRIMMNSCGDWGNGLNYRITSLFCLRREQLSN